MTRTRNITVLLGCLWAIAVTAVYASVMQPSRNPARFYREMHADQGMMITYMQKDYGLSSFTGDFVFSVGPKSPRMYNPLNLALLHFVSQHRNGNIPDAFYLLTLAAVSIYVWIAFIVFSHVAAGAGPRASFVIAGLVAAASTEYLYFAVGSDIWGLGPLPTSRASQYVLPLVVAVMYGAMRTFGERRMGRLFFIFVGCGLAAVVHPVTGLHLFIVLATTALGFEWVSRRPIVVPAMVRTGGFIVGALPTIVSVLRNHLFGFGASPGADNSPVASVDPAQIAQAIDEVDPAAADHRMPILLRHLPHPHAITRPLALALIGVFVLAAILCVMGLIRARWRGMSISNCAAKSLFLLMLALSSAMLWMMTCLLRPDQPLIDSWRGPWWYVLAALVAGVPVIYGLVISRRGAAPFDYALLASFFVVLFWTVIGSWVFNAILIRMHSPVGDAEQIRGLRIAWAGWLFMLAIVLADGWKSQRLRMVAVAVGMAVSILFAASLHGLWRNERAADPQSADWLAAASWVKLHTPADALVAVATTDLRNDSIRLKAYSGRGMAFSYDAINIVYTNPPGQIQAARRLRDLTAVTEGNAAPADAMRNYSIDYLVMDASRWRTDEKVVYRNTQYVILQR